MKKKISLNNLQLRKEKVSNLNELKGGGEPHNTFDVYCANNTLYPACGWSGCWGARTCEPATED